MVRPVICGEMGPLLIGPFVPLVAAGDERVIPESFNPRPDAARHNHPGVSVDVY